MRAPFEHYEVLIANACGDQICIEVVIPVFGQTPVGEAHNELVIAQRQFIDDAIREKVERD